MKSVNKMTSEILGLIKMSSIVLKTIIIINKNNQRCSFNFLKCKEFIDVVADQCWLYHVEKLDSKKSRVRFVEIFLCGICVFSSGTGFLPQSEDL